jgi:hypothetical protein
MAALAYLQSPAEMLAFVSESFSLPYSVTSPVLINFSRPHLALHHIISHRPRLLRNTHPGTLLF